jgi:hypothetical protein
VITALSRRQTGGVKRPLQVGLLLVVMLAFVLTGCGAPGEPVPPTPPIPTVIADLSAQQAGDGVLLTFTMPGKSISGDKLKEVPAMEVLRGSLAADGTIDPRTFRVVETVPGAMVASYTKKGTVQLLDPIPADESRAHPGETVVYQVRARVTDKKTSANSNGATLKLFPVAAKIETLQARLTEQGIELTWTAPERTSGGEPLQGIEEYHVYRGELDPASTAAASKEISAAVWKMPLLQIAAVKALEYRDSAFDYGKTYVYVVRATLGGSSAALESGNSGPVILTPQDTFPPAAPRGITAAVLPGVAAGKYVVDLSWSINVEADLAGYRVYRSEQLGVRGSPVNAELLPTPAYRDDSVGTSKNYWYTVTAVDRAGNESPLSEQTVVDISPPSP